MYRTAYQDMRDKKPVAKNNYMVPGYAGFVPGKEGNSELGRTFTKITRRCIEKEGNLQSQKTAERFKSTGGFADDQKKFDETRPNSFGGYGKTTLPVPHPCLENPWATSYGKSFVEPDGRSKPTAHTKNPGRDLEFDNATKANHKRMAASSGFQANA